MTNSTYYVRVSKAYDADGDIYTEKYITTTSSDGTEWVVNASSGELEFPIGNVSAAADDVIARRVSFDEAQRIIKE